MACGSWEDRDYSHLLDRLLDRDSDSEDDPSELLPHECSQLFMDMLISMKLEGVISAKQACVLSYWAKRGGLAPPGDALALSPASSGGHFSRHFDKVLGVDLKQDLYRVCVPGHRKHDRHRASRDVSVCLPFEALCDELEENPGILQTLKEQARANIFPDAYYLHPVVRNHEMGTVLPVGLYVDGVRYLRRDSTIGFWLINMVTHRRHLMACLPKREFCKCGCRGYCSLYPIMVFVEWCMATLAAGKVPATRHDGSPWTGNRADIANLPLPFKAACIIVKGDWAEMNTTLGFRAWNHHAHPCFRCKARAGPAGNMHIFEGLSTVQEYHAAKTQDDYDAYCSGCEILVSVENAMSRDRLVAALEYSRKHRGRALTEHLHLRSRGISIVLKAGDRLQPSRSLLDISALDTAKEFPLDVVFWRSKPEDAIRFRCPIFGGAAGITVRSLCVDELHTMHLGVFQDYILAVFWSCIKADLWRPLRRSDNSEDQVRHDSVLGMKGELFGPHGWYASQKREFPNRPCHELQELTVDMLGTPAHPKLHAKAAESGTLCRFARYLAERHREKLASADALISAGDGLVGYLDATRGKPLRLDAICQVQLCSSILKFICAREAAGVAWKPKTHLCSHIVKDSREHGNPARTGTWLDETLNMHLASVAGTANSSVWSDRAMATFGHVRGPTAIAAARKGKKRLRPGLADAAL